jgi:hypothetical protein
MYFIIVIIFSRLAYIVTPSHEKKDSSSVLNPPSRNWSANA